MALVHDLAESIVGDITPSCGVSKEEKIQRELVRAWVYTWETSMQPASFPQLLPNTYVPYRTSTPASCTPVVRYHVTKAELTLVLY